MREREIEKKGRERGRRGERGREEGGGEKRERRKTEVFLLVAALCFRSTIAREPMGETTER